MTEKEVRDWPWFWRALGGTVISLVVLLVVTIFNLLSNSIQSNTNGVAEMKLVVGELKGEQKSLSEMIKTSDQKFEERFTKIGQSRKDFDKEIREQVAQCMKEFGVVKEKLAALDEKSKGLEEKSKGLDEKLKTAEVKKPSGDAR